MEKSAVKVVELQKTIMQYISQVYLTTDKEGVGEKVVNPLLASSVVGKNIRQAPDLEWMKSSSCSVPGVVPADVKRKYVDCSYKPDTFSLTYQGSWFDFVAYNNLAFPRAKRIAVNGYSIYSFRGHEFENAYDVISKIPNINSVDGFRLANTDIEIGEMEITGDTITRIGEWKTISNVLTTNLDEVNSFIEKMKASDKTIGAKVKIFYDSEVTLKRDGSVPLALNAPMCWDSANDESRPCIRLKSKRGFPKQDYLVVDSGFAFGVEKKRTPVTVQYHSFGSGGGPVEVPFLTCPVNEEGSNWTNQLVALNSSFSSGSEAGTDFSNPASIVSKGTKGAGGKHAFLSGLSLEWEKGTRGGKEVFLINGAVAIDGAYKKDNGDSSVLKNPRSMSFVTMQWCEEE
ncbi:hypothetical protein [Enterovibrio coralii]|uniref:hypothetical protein n=1 Tax=Enterovibrio coralii TaxID=294935 RepID=UPI0012F7BBF8|nr:hypothetical protein [Enterovibrio coralii]